MTKLYQTKRDAIEQVIIPALESDVSEFDVEAIADEVCVWTDQHAFTIIEGDAFWDAALRHQKSA